MQITARICIYTNDTLLVETVSKDEGDDMKGEGRATKDEEATEATTGKPL